MTFEITNINERFSLFSIEELWDFEKPFTGLLEYPLPFKAQSLDGSGIATDVSLDIVYSLAVRLSADGKKIQVAATWKDTALASPFRTLEPFTWAKGDHINVSGVITAADSPE